MDPFSNVRWTRSHRVSSSYASGLASSYHDEDQKKAQAILADMQASPNSNVQNPDGSTTNKFQDFLNYIPGLAIFAPGQYKGLFNQRDMAQVARVAEEGGRLARDKVVDPISNLAGGERNDKFDGAGDLLRFVGDLAVGVPEGLLTAGKNFHEAGYGTRVNFDEDGNMLEETEKLTATQRAAAGAVGVLDTVGLAAGGSGKFIKELFKKPLDNALKTTAKSAAKDTAKDTVKDTVKNVTSSEAAKTAGRMGVEGFEESLSSVAEDLQDDSQLSEDWLANAGKGFALGVAAGGIFDVSGRAVGKVKGDVKTAKINKQTGTSADTRSSISKRINEASDLTDAQRTSYTNQLTQIAQDVNPVEDADMRIQEFNSRADEALEKVKTEPETPATDTAPVRDSISPEKAKRLVEVDTKFNARLNAIEQEMSAIRENNDPSVKRVIASDGTDVTAVADKFEADIATKQRQIRDLQQQADGIDNNTGEATAPEGVDPSEYTGDAQGRTNAAEQVIKLRQEIEDLKAKQAEQFEMLGGVQTVIDTQAVSAKYKELKRQRSEILDWKIRNNLGETAESLAQKKADIDNDVISDEFVRVREPIETIEAAVAMARESDHNDVSEIQRAAVINQIHREAAEQKLADLWTQQKSEEFKAMVDAEYKLREAEIKEMPAPRQKGEMMLLEDKYASDYAFNEGRLQEDAGEVEAAERALEIADDIDRRIVERANSILESDPMAFGKVDPEEMIEIQSGIDVALTLKKVEADIAEATMPNNVIRESDLSTDDARRSPKVTPEQFQAHYEAGRAKMEKFNSTKAEPTAIVNDEQWTSLVDDAYNTSRNEWDGETYNAVTGEKVAKDADAYALTIRDEGMDTVSVSPTASKAEFAKAMETAKKKYAHILEREGAHLGVFNDADTGRIDIDPVMITENLQDVHDIGAYTKATGGAYHFKSGDGFWPPHVANSAPANTTTITPLESEGAVTQAVRNAADAEEAGIIIDEDPRLSDQAATVIADQIGAGNLKGQIRDTFIITTRDALLKLENGDKLVGELDYAIMEMAKSDDTMKIRAKVDKWKLTYKNKAATDQSIAYWDQGEPLTKMDGESDRRFKERQKAADSVKAYFDDAAKRRGLRTNEEANQMVAELKSQRNPENAVEIDRQIAEINSKRMVDNYFTHMHTDMNMDIDSAAEALARLESGVNEKGNKLTQKQREMLNRKIEGIDLGTQQIIAKRGIYKVGKDGHAIKRQGAEGWSRDIPFVLEMYQRSTNRSVYMQPALDNIAKMTGDLKGRQLEFVEQSLKAVTGQKFGSDLVIGNRAQKVLKNTRRLSNAALMGLSVRTIILQPTSVLNNWRLDAEQGGNTAQFISSTLKSIRVSLDPRGLSHSPALREFLEEGGMQGSWAANLRAGTTTRVENVLFSGIGLMDRTMRFGAYDQGKQTYLKNNAKDPKNPTAAEYSAAKRAGIAAAQEAQFGLGPLDVPLAQNTEVNKSIFQLQQFNMKQFGREAEFLVGKEGVFRKNGWIDEKTGNLNAKGAKNLMKTIVGYSAVHALYTQLQVGDDENSKNPFGLGLEDMLPFGELIMAVVDGINPNEEIESVQMPLPPVYTALFGRGGRDKGIRGHLADALMGGDDIDRGDALADAMQSAIRQFIPMGTQLNRSYEGGKAVIRGESMNDSGSTRFLVDNSSGWNIIKGLVAGQYATTEGQEWLRNGMNTIPKDVTIEHEGKKIPVSEFVRDYVQDPAIKAQYIGYYATKNNAKKQLAKQDISTSDVLENVRTRLTAGYINQAQAALEIRKHNDLLVELYRPYMQENKNLPKYVTLDFMDNVLLSEDVQPINYR